MSTGMLYRYPRGTRWAVVLTVLIVALAGAHLHGDGEASLDRGGFGGGGHVQSAESHPDSPLHMESFALERVKECVGCFLRDKTRGLQDLLVTVSPSPAGSFGVVPTPLAALLASRYPTAIPRAPPSG